MAELLGSQGMVAADAADADLVVLNTCHIRERATEKVYSEIGRLKHRDTAPAPGNPVFTNIVGEHDVNDAGTTVFSATVAGEYGRGVYTIGANGLARVAVGCSSDTCTGDAGPAGLGSNVTFVAIVGNPAISDDGTVAFRARVQFTDGQGATRRRDGIFVRSGSQVRAIMSVAIENLRQSAVIKALSGLPEVAAIHTTNGRWDLIAELEVETLEAFSRALDAIRELEGIAATETSLLLATQKL